MKFERGDIIQFLEDGETKIAKIQQVLENDDYLVSYAMFFKGRRVEMIGKKGGYEISIVKDKYTTSNIDGMYGFSSLNKHTQLDLAPAYENEKANSLRDMVAMHALQGLLAQENVDWHYSTKEAVKVSFEYADEFLKQRKQKGGANG